jgi:hypothetical protein
MSGVISVLANAIGTAINQELSNLTHTNDMGQLFTTQHISPEEDRPPFNEVRCSDGSLLARIWNKAPPISEVQLALSYGFVRCSKSRRWERIEHYLSSSDRKCMTSELQNAFTVVDRNKVYIKYSKKCEKICQNCRERYVSKNIIECDKKRKLTNPEQPKKKRVVTITEIKEGYKHCTACGEVKPLKTFEAGSKKGTHRQCKTCRDRKRKKTPQEEACWKIYQDWRKNSVCKDCGITDWRLLEADHVGNKTRNCSDYAWWARNGGPEALLEELQSVCEPRCIYHHRQYTYWRDKMEKDNGKTYSNNKNAQRLRKMRAEVQNYAVSLKTGNSCYKCKRICTPENVMCFDWDHLPDKMHLKKYNVGDISQKYATSFKDGKNKLDQETAICRLSCVFCHRLYTHYSDENNIFYYINEDLVNKNMFANPLQFQNEIQTEVDLIHSEIQKHHAKDVTIKDVLGESSEDTTSPEKEYKTPEHYWIFDDNSPTPVVLGADPALPEHGKRVDHARYYSLKQQNSSEPVQGTTEWFDLRNSVEVTGSKLTKLYYARSEEERDLHYEIVRNITKSIFTVETEAYCEWGKRYEDLALYNFLKLNPDYRVMEPSLVKHDQYPYGASPDGIYGVMVNGVLEKGVVEIKCPGKSKKCTSSPSPHYLAQMFLEMACTGTRTAIFISWGPDRMKAWKIKWDQLFWDELHVLIQDLIAIPSKRMSYEDFKHLQNTYLYKCDYITQNATPLHPVKGKAHGWKLKNGHVCDI